MFKPINKISSVKEVVYVFRLTDDNLFRTYRQMSEEEIRVRFEKFSFVGYDNPSEAIPVTINFEFGEPEDLQWAIKLSEDAIFIYNFDFTKWNIIYKKFFDILNALINNIDVFFEGIQLYTMNSFVELMADTPDGPSRNTEVFNADSEFFPRIYFRSNGRVPYELKLERNPFHEDIGLVLDGFKITRDPLLDKAGDEEPFLTGIELSILFENTYMFKLSTDKGVLLANIINSNIIKDIFDDAHNNSMAIFKDILHPNIIADLGLAVENGYED